MLLFNVKKYLALKKRSDNNKKNAATVRTHIKSGEITENVQRNAGVKFEQNFVGAPKPEIMARWESEFFELTRQMTSQIDMKMSALNTLTYEAKKTCQKLETLIDEIERKSASLQQASQANYTKQTASRVQATQENGTAEADYFGYAEQSGYSENPSVNKSHVTQRTEPRKTVDSVNHVNANYADAAFTESNSGAETATQRTKSAIYAEIQDELEQELALLNESEGNYSEFSDSYRAKTEKAAAQKPNQTKNSEIFPRMAPFTDLGFTDELGKFAEISSELNSSEIPNPYSTSTRYDETSSKYTTNSPKYPAEQSKSGLNTSSGTTNTSYSESSFAASLPKFDPSVYEKSKTLGELLLEEKRQEQPLRLQPTPAQADAANVKPTSGKMPVQPQPPTPPGGTVLRPVPNGFVPKQAATVMPGSVNYQQHNQQHNQPQHNTRPTHSAGGVSPNSSRHQLVRELAQQGMSIDEISYKMEMSIGEIELALGQFRASVGHGLRKSA
ncbi:MAG: hypothetical protein ACRC2T_10435 [Thermoguttaceae bacterium]